MLRKLLWTLALCCLPWMARGQASSTFDYRYWFDNDDANARAATAAGANWHIDADLSGLDNSLHRFYFQVKDTAGVWSSPVMRLFLKYGPVGLNNNTYYWFDTNSAARTPLPAAQGKMQIDVSQLIDGVHDISIQNFADVSSPSNGYTARFLKQPVMDQLEVVYWLDNQQNTLRGGKFENGIMMLDVKDFDDGFHILYLQATGKGGQSVPVSRMFIKVPQTDGIEYMTCTCTVDGQQYKQERVPSSGGIVNWNLDVSGLQPGVHRLQVQAITPSGAASNVYDGMFFRASRPSELAAMKCLYNIDGSTYKTAIGSYNDGLYHFDLDVAALTDGLHQLNYMMIGEDGTGTQAKSTFFVKIPVGGYGITSYKYWLNSNREEATEVKLDKRAAVLSIVDLLPMPTAPIRSECFQFEVNKDGVPYVYAKNDLHFEFADASERVVDAHKQFVDYNVSQEVTDITPLLPTQTFARPNENTVKWFSFEACKGDTIAFRSSQATSLQVFSPTGQEIYAASGDKSVKYGGCHTWEDGTYYLAVHDVTGSQANIKLDFMHMDKYDVVSQDVSVVGNGGASTITYRGNGFNDLYAVDLYNENGDTIRSQAICYLGNEETSVTFDFTDRTKGTYKSRFYFTNEIKEFAISTTVEKAYPIELDLVVNYPQYYLRGSDATYIVTIRNKGNSTAYDVPVEIGVEVDGTFEDIKKISFSDNEGLSVHDDFWDNLEIDSIDGETLQFLKAESLKLTGKHSFVVVNDSLHNGNFGFSDLLVTIPPNGTSKIYIKITSNKTIDLFARISSDWITVNSRKPIQNINSNVICRSQAVSDLCCEKEKWECSANIAASIAGLVPGVGCAAALADAALFTTFEIACADGNSLGEKAKDFFRSVANNKSQQKSVIDRSVNAFLSCALSALGKMMKMLKDELAAAKLAQKKAYDAVSLARKQQEESIQAYRYLRAKGDEALAAGNAEQAKIYWDSSAEALANAERYGQEASAHYNKAKSYDSVIADLMGQINTHALDVMNLMDNIRNGLSTALSASDCVQAWKKAAKDCPPRPKTKGGKSTPVSSFDPNDIYGYTSASGSRFMSDSIQNVSYRIEFENDTTFATASAHMVEVKDTLDARYFDLASYAPTGFKIGDKTEYLEGTPQFVKTVDMRPQINAIVQVEGLYDKQKGIATWRFTSLDPMTMEPTDDVMQGFLPVNYDGESGIGEVTFDVALRQKFTDGTEIPNKASIVFDSNEPIMTPVWINTVDAVCPESRVLDVTQKNDTTLTINYEGHDSRSGVWKYEVYAQYGSGNTPWEKVAETAADSCNIDFRFYKSIDYGFCVLAVDSAGNVEQKPLAREGSFADVDMGDVNGDGEVNTLDASLTTAYYLGKQAYIIALAADVNGDGVIDTLDATQITQMFLDAQGIAPEINALPRRRVKPKQTLQP